jgi:hypothetical protein
MTASVALWSSIVLGACAQVFLKRGVTRPDGREPQLLDRRGQPQLKTGNLLLIVWLTDTARRSTPFRPDTPIARRRP